MDDLDARDILATEIDRLRALSYDELGSLTSQVRQVRGVRRGDVYNLEVETFFDDRRTRNLRSWSRSITADSWGDRDG